MERYGSASVQSDGLNEVKAEPQGRVRGGPVREFSCQKGMSRHLRRFVYSNVEQGQMTRHSFGRHGLNIST